MTANECKNTSVVKNESCRDMAIRDAAKLLCENKKSTYVYLYYRAVGSKSIWNNPKNDHSVIVDSESIYRFSG